MHSAAAVLFACLLLPAPAAAVLIDSGDGTGNLGAPPDDPGFVHVGSAGGLSAVYLGNGWVLTANHVGARPVSFGGVSYGWLSGSEVRLRNGDGTDADLLLFGITPEPPLPDLPIRAATSLPVGEVILAGNGRNRGAFTDTSDPLLWPDPNTAPVPPIEGYWWGNGSALRWGTNLVEDDCGAKIHDTVCFYTVFDDAGPWATDHEAQVAVGDSGGALFATHAGSWELAGLLYLRSLYVGQASSSALYGNASIAADLSFYRDQILFVTALPEPAQWLQLSAGSALLALLRRRRGRRGERIRGSERVGPVRAPFTTRLPWTYRVLGGRGR